MVNEFTGRLFPCDQIVPAGPAYNDVPQSAMACAAKGARLGNTFVDGDEFVRVAYGYENDHKWRNFGILIAFTIGLCIAHLVVSEVIAAARSKGEVLVFKRGALKGNKQSRALVSDEEQQTQPKHRDQVTDGKDNIAANVEKQTSILHWQDVSYKVPTGGEERVILDHVDGWVKPGTLTALMGVSGVSLILFTNSGKHIVLTKLTGWKDHTPRCFSESHHRRRCHWRYPCRRCAA